MSFSRSKMLCFTILIITTICISNGFTWDKPWDELTEDWWIDFADGNDPNMYPVNATDFDDINDFYKIAFLEETTDDRARGMNALKFIYGGTNEGHMVTKNLTGIFDITNTGDSNRYDKIVILVAIADSYLASDFNMSLNMKGQTPYDMNDSHFAYYDGVYGRPSGFYSATDPNSEAITYAHNSAMVTVYGVSGMTEPLGYIGDPLYGNVITIEYSFSNLPAPAVFSVYAVASTTGGPEIYHTNRALIDTNNTKKKISTFAVTISSDINNDLKVDLLDFAEMTDSWLVGAR